ncbi:MAG: class I SAM-dependent DNA methyltransferase [Planctomycetota bacterium]|jgi:SAM-dependent methyltransferase
MGSKLTTTLARATHEVNRTLVDYAKEFQKFDRFLKKTKCKEILELGCGSGNLAPHFLDRGYRYLGLDLSRPKIEIARETESRATFIQGDMRRLNLRKRFDAILISGKSFAHLTKNEDVLSTLSAVTHHLREKGYLLFDNYDASVKVFTKSKRKIQEQAKFEERAYKRIIRNTWNFKTGWTWKREVTYKIREGKRRKTLKSKAVLRAFTEDELHVYLRLSDLSPVRTSKSGETIFMAARRM